MRLVLIAAVAMLARAEIVTYDLRPAEGSRFALIVYKTGLLSGKKHLFLFERYRGTLLHDPAEPERSRVEMHIDATSAVCKDTWVSEKDRRKIERVALHDMMQVEHHPELIFLSERVARQPGGTYQVQGTLSIRGVARPAVATVRVAESGERIASVSGESTVRMKDYGMKPPSAALGTIGTKNEMTVEFVLVPASATQISTR